MPEVILPGAVEQEEEEEEEEGEATLTLRLRGLRSRGPAILAEGEPAGKSAMAEGVERPEEAMEVLEDEIPGVLTRHKLLRPMREGRRCNNLGLPVY